MPLSISLVTPNLNYGHHLGRTISSVVNQNYPALDYLVVDGGSTDDSHAVLKASYAPALRWEILPDVGQYASINHGFSKTRGEIMGWINSDDMMMPWTLHTVAEIFAAFPDIDWICGAPSVIQQGAVQAVDLPKPFSREALTLGLYAGGASFGLVQQESCFWRRTLWDRAGGLDERNGLAADFELWMRFARHAELAGCAALLGGFSVHAKNRSRVQASAYADEIARVLTALPAEARARRARLSQWRERYDRHRWLPGLKGLTRRLGGLVEIDGPVIRRDIVANRFTLRRERLFP